MTKTAEKEPEQKAQSINLTDPIALSQAMQTVWEKAGPLLSEINNLLSERFSDSENKPIDPLNLRTAWAEYMNYALAQPEKIMVRQFLWWNGCMSLWQDYALKTLGSQNIEDIIVLPEKGDRRFSADEWQSHPLFNFLKQAYLLTGRHILESLNDFDDLDKQTRERLDFTLRQYISALSPTNFLFSNPEVLRETIETNGQNLIKGLENLLSDLERGHGELRISMTDYKAFEIGKNIAATEGSVVYRNEIMELIQYKPTTKKVLKEPLLILPPWINRYYILDLGEQKSLVKWLVGQGHTVFMVSWVNPDAKLGHLEFSDYIDKGFLEALNQVEKITKSSQTNVIGYCIGGTMLSMGLSYLKSAGQEKRIKTTTFLTTLLDFEDAGELKLFTTEAQIELIEFQMEKAGNILPSEVLKATFSMLRSNDLIWNFVINNYLIGKSPFPFDLLYWNDDSTNLPAKMHSYYLRNMYLKNKLKEPDALSFKGKKIDLSKIKYPTYFLSCREDHIAPWRATYKGMKLLDGDRRFVLSGSGHIAGVVNPPIKNKYGYWTSDKKPMKPDTWIEKAEEHEGSWWTDWQKWVETYSKEKVEARTIKNEICPAPGTYVKN